MSARCKDDIGCNMPSAGNNFPVLLFSRAMNRKKGQRTSSEHEKRMDRGCVLHAENLFVEVKGDLGILDTDHGVVLIENGISKKSNEHQ